VAVSSKRAERQPPPLPEPLTPLVDAHTHLDACGARTADDVLLLTLGTGVGGAVLLGGMLVSTLVTLVLVPLLLGICFRLFPVR